MREILFRGQIFGSREWVYGHYRTGRKIHIIYHDENSDNCYAVLPETVGQYTGLTANGKKIFEGDVVLYPWNDQDKPERFTIKFKDGQFVASPVKETEDYWDFMVGGYSKEMEVIGNIHDNPELLEVEDGK